MFASIEAGGTKFVCALANKDCEIIDRKSFPTTVPTETLQAVVEYFLDYKEEIQAISIGSFGPIDVNPKSKTYGFITNTPKLAWRQFNFVGYLKEYFKVPITWTTDVNASAYGEAKIGAGKGQKSVAYYTVGTGIGGGLVQDGQFLEGYSHPEMGHLLVRRHPEDEYLGHCPNHCTCLEGMACGLAIEDRLGMKGQNLASDHPYWDIEAYYIAQSAYTTSLFLSPNVIIYGGGVMAVEGLINKVRHHYSRLMKGYLQVPDLDKYIVTPQLGNNAATYGCILMAKDMVNSNTFGLQE